MLNLSAMQKAFFLALFLSPPVAVAMKDSAGQVAGQIVAQPPGGRRPGVVQPPRDTGAAPETGTARLQGVVVGGEAGQPLRRAIVHISGEGLREGRATMTDAEGRWQLAGLPAGRYTLVASKAGYVTLQYGQRRAFVPGRPIEFADGQTLENVNFNLPRGAVLAGRIVDEFGEPVANVSVVAMRYRFANGRRQLVPAAGRFAETDDGGHFRIYGLPPGEFYLSATLRSFMGLTSDDSHGYAPTYYPGAMSPQHAEPIALSLGGEVSGLTFSLLPVRTVTIAGVALDSQGRPMANAFLQITVREGAGFMSSGGNRTREDGSFRVTNVVPGDYTLIAAPVDRMRGRDAVELAIADVTVGSEDINGLVLAPLRGATVRGRVILEGGAADPPSPSAISIVALPFGESSPAFFMTNSPSQVEPDWTFELRVPRSPALLVAHVIPPDWTLKSILVGGEDVADIGLTFRDGDTIPDVEVVLTRTQTHVSGSVTDDRGQPVSDYSVVLFADDPTYWEAPFSRRIGLARPDQSGRWSVDGLPPGRYVAAAVEAIEEGEERNPALLERLRTIGTPFTLGEGGRHTMQLTVQQVY